MAVRAGIALGSNLGNRLTNLRKARDMLLTLMPEGTQNLQSPVYISSPVNCPPDSPDFFNAVIEIDFVGTPHDLLRDTQGIEFHIGRVAVSQTNAPRIIDLDIIYFDDLVMRDGGILTIPHPRLIYRRFVLHPLADIRPDLILPGDVTTIGEHFRQLDSDEPELSMLQSAW